jgi:ubiquinone biosynthesis protein UbiJ
LNNGGLPGAAEVNALCETVKALFIDVTALTTRLNALRADVAALTTRINPILP